ncbi:leucine--tRNA ligase [Kineococcus rhizosphaerae]|uniref:Leucine--tRNA ligase n=1 Tax=Kineococcus rhizosphaerae TaxID=559628 RepID=A0A2T0R7S3_9ACTN|nr:leucine--tRNA ligase [Kineococcus rhizosphaerae]PRY17208.1 leucyl-tRNA synthetase [Kineococcus rhizosphaerae]
MTQDVGQHAQEQTEEQDGQRYDAFALQDKWLPVWDELKPFRSGEPGDTRPKKYVLDMFPYPSGDLHMGHAEAYALGDVIARYWLQRGFDVMHPIGWDAFGLPAENAAIKRGLDPRRWTYDNIAQQRASMRRYACSFDWDRVLHTSDPEYYKWNQWLFLKLYEKGLAYRKDSLVNWDPVDQTVLANEQVLPDGTSERSGAKVVKKKLTQWYFRITEYADRLLDDLDTLEGQWPAKVISMQRNWIGRSTGAEVEFAIEGRDEPVTVYTTRPDTLHGATFMVVAADSDLAEELAAGSAPEVREQFEAYRTRVQETSDMDRLASEREKTGVDLGRFALNPVNGEKLPIWAADYVLADYGTGAIMAVPAHDQRDLDFARTFGLPVRVVVDVRDGDGNPLPDPAVSGEATAGDGVLVNSGPLDGLDKKAGIAQAIELLAEQGKGRPAKNYRLRDWLISRQRYWGTPIPIVHTETGEVPVPEDQLPVLLPPSEGLNLTPKGTSPLGAAEHWVNVPSPVDGSPARRDPDTMDTFVDSSWYYLRFVSPHDDTKAFDTDLIGQWGPIDQYVGGVTHAILHLLYARFITKVLHDLGYVPFDEPFTRLLNQGMVQMEGSAMSKSKGNIVRLSDQLEEHGVDAIRLTMAFAGPPEDDIDWADVSPSGSAKFLGRAWRLARDVTSAAGADPATGDLALRQVTHRTLHEVAQHVEAYRFNVAVARVMELVNATRKAIDSGPGAGDAAVREATEAVAIVLSLFAPYVAEDMWSLLGHEPAVARAGWPAVDEALLVEDTVTCVVQVKGKVRDRLEVAPDITAEALQELAMASDKVRAAIEGRSVRTVIVRAPKLVNVVTA